MWLYSDEQHFSASVNENLFYSEDPDYRLRLPFHDEDLSIRRQ